MQYSGMKRGEGVLPLALRQRKSVQTQPCVTPTDGMKSGVGLSKALLKKSGVQDETLEPDLESREDFK